jgi:hypothetical protein
MADVMWAASLCGFTGLVTLARTWFVIFPCDAPFVRNTVGRTDGRIRIDTDIKLYGMQICNCKVLGTSTARKRFSFVVNEWMTEWFIEWTGEWMSEWLTDWMIHSLNELVNEWINEWMNEWMNFNNSKTQNWVFKRDVTPVAVFTADSVYATVLFAPFHGTFTCGCASVRLACQFWLLHCLYIVKTDYYWN